MSDRKTIDPRIKLTLLPIVGFTSFFISDTILLFGLIVFAFFLYVYSGMWKRALCFILFFVLLYCIELGIGKFCEASIVFAIYMFIYFASRMTLIADGVNLLSVNELQNYTLIKVFNFSIILLSFLFHVKIL